MYLPDHFTEKEETEVIRLMESFPLALLIGVADGKILANAIPLILDPDGALIGHLALANSLHEQLEDNAPVLAVFSGENSYISPNWYPTKPETHRQVPTWHYQMVQVHGHIRFSHDDKDKRAVVGRQTRFFEQRYSGKDAWRIADAPKDYMDGMLDRIVALKIKIDDLTAKSKLGQQDDIRDFNNVAKVMKEIGKSTLYERMRKI